MLALESLDLPLSSYARQSHQSSTKCAAASVLGCYGRRIAHRVLDGVTVIMNMAKAKWCPLSSSTRQSQSSTECAAASVLGWGGGRIAHEVLDGVSSILNIA
jgi:hypothetical protein